MTHCLVDDSYLLLIAGALDANIHILSLCNNFAALVASDVSACKRIVADLCIAEGILTSLKHRLPVRAFAYVSYLL